MEKLKDAIHHCEECDIFPCSTQEEIERLDICGQCPVPCCYKVLVALTPCEDNMYKHKDVGALKMGDDGWCGYYDDNVGCTIYDIRPVICRVASCRFVREGKIPKELKDIEKRKRMNG